MCQLPFPILFLSSSPPPALTISIRNVLILGMDSACQAGLDGPVVQTMRCDGCKTIQLKKRTIGDEREQRGKELTLLDRFNYAE